MTTARPPSMRTDWMRGVALSDLTRTQKLVAYTIGQRMHADGNGAHPSYPRIAAESGYGLSTVKRVVGKLEDIGALAVTKGGGRHVVNRYQARIPSHWWDRIDAERRPKPSRSGAETVPLDDRNGPAGGTRSRSTEVHREGASRVGRKRQEPDRYHVADEDCRCQACLDGHRAVPDAS
jgi:hypothetical protein